MNKHIKNFHSSPIAIIEEIKFQDRSNLISLSEFHHNGGSLTKGMEIVCERSLRAKLLTGALQSWHIGSVPYDITGYGKYSESHTVVEINGKSERWPFSMLYVKK